MYAQKTPANLHFLSEACRLTERGMDKIIVFALYVMDIIAAYVYAFVSIQQLHL